MVKSHIDTLEAARAGRDGFLATVLHENTDRTIWINSCGCNWLYLTYLTSQRKLSHFFFRTSSAGSSRIAPNVSAPQVSKLKCDWWNAKSIEINGYIFFKRTSWCLKLIMLDSHSFWCRGTWNFGRTNHSWMPLLVGRKGHENKVDWSN